MRVIVIKQRTDLQALVSTLKMPPAGKGAAKEVGQATLELIKRLNPHVLDFQRIDAGTVLLLPDSPVLNDSQALTGNSFKDFEKQTEEGFGAVIKRMQISARALADDFTDVNAVLKKTEAVKRLSESDQLLLKNQLDGARMEFESGTKKAHEATKQVATMQAAAAEELKALVTVLR